MEKEIFQPKIEEPKKEKREIKHKPIAELREPIKNLLEQLREKIDGGEYQLIIGDDASGRIPALILEKIIRNIYREKDYLQPEMIFFAGSRRLTADKGKEKAEKIGNHLKKIIKKIKEKTEKSKPKALVITDVIETGISLKPLSMALEKNNIDFDIATIGALPKMWEMKEGFLAGKIFYGEIGIPNIYGWGTLSGLKKEPQEIFAEPLKKQLPKVSAADAQKTIQETRQDARILADELVEWYKKHYEKNK